MERLACDSRLCVLLGGALPYLPNPRLARPPPTLRSLTYRAAVSTTRSRRAFSFSSLSFYLNVRTTSLGSEPLVGRSFQSNAAVDNPRRFRGPSFRKKPYTTPLTAAANAVRCVPQTPAQCS